MSNVLKLLKRYADDKLNYILQGLTDECGEFRVISDKPCECCGDTIDETFLDLDK